MACCQIRKLILIELVRVVEDRLCACATPNLLNSRTHLPKYMLKNAIIVVLSIIFLSSMYPLHQAMGQSTATVSVQLTTTSVLNMNDTFSINITVSNVIGLSGWQVVLFYPSSVLNGTQVDEGPFLMAGGSTTFLANPFTDNSGIATYGVLIVGDTLLADANVSGSGTLATVTFKAVGSGPCVLHIDTTGSYHTISTELLGVGENNDIPFTTVDGQITIVPEFPSLAILPLFMIATIVSLIAFRKLKIRGAKPKQ